MFEVKVGIKDAECNWKYYRCYTTKLYLAYDFFKDVATVQDEDGFSFIPYEQTSFSCKKVTGRGILTEDE